MRLSKKAFSLVELLSVILITGIGVSLFSIVFINNWFAYEDRINRANLLNETNQIIDQMSFEGRNAKQVDITTGSDKTTIIYYSALDNSQVIFEMRRDGALTVAKSGKTRILTNHLDFDHSSAAQINGEDLTVNLTLKDMAGTRDIHVTAGSEILMRN